MKPNPFYRLLLVVSVVLTLPVGLSAEVKLPRILGSHMVLQRDREVRIWGWAGPRERVTVQFNGQTEKTRAAKDGTWQVTLNPMKAGGPHAMVISGENTITLEDVLIGDVWVCSGQSNMEWTVANSDNPEEEIASADYPEIRLFEVPHNVQLAPVEDIPSGEWAACRPSTVRNFSAVGYFFGRALHNTLEVPVGLISSNWGGTNVETWTSRQMALTDPEMAEAVKGMDTLNAESLKARKERERRELLASLGELGSGMQDGNPVWAAPGLDPKGWNPMEVPGLWEEKGLSGVDGVVWFRRTVRISPEQAEGAAVLRLGAIDDSDITWVNGVKVGETLNQYNAEREYPLEPGVLKPGENTLAVRVEDTGGGGGFWGAPENMELVTANGPVPLAGEWQFRASSEGFRIRVQSAIHPNSLPTLLFNGMIHPLLDFPVLGAIWYQGESNASRAFRYRTLFPNMIRDWRAHWNDPDLGFYFVQLANFRQPAESPGESDWAELREAQAMALSLPKTGMAVTIDIGEADDIHPRNKQDVGERLARVALADTYGKEVVFSGPVFRSLEVDGERAIATFDPMGSELVVRDKYGYVKGFAVAGEDRVFHWARGSLDGNRIILQSGKVERPVAVRYGWADNPEDVNLYNSEGLPASPFRTDDWPGITRER